MIRYVTSHGRNDGLGMQVIQAMSTFAYARRHNLTYVHTPMRYPCGDEFFGFGKDELTKVDDWVMSCAWINRDAERWEGLLDLFKEKYRSVPKECYYDPSRINVAIHVRRGDVRRGYRFTENESILAIYRQLAAREDCNFHLFSQGEPEDFRAFEGAELYLDEDLFLTFHHMVMADVLVMAKSSLSYTAAMLSDGVKIYEPFFFPPLDGWLVRNILLSEEQMKTLDRRIDHGQWRRTAEDGGGGACRDQDGRRDAQGHERRVQATRFGVRG